MLSVVYFVMLPSMWRNCAGNSTLCGTKESRDFCEWVCIASHTH